MITELDVDSDGIYPDLDEFDRGEWDEWEDKWNPYTWTLSAIELRVLPGDVLQRLSARFR